MATAKSTEARSTPAGPAFPTLADFERLNARVTELEAKLARVSARRVFTGDDQQFLIWTLGFTAGANLERDGERGERIYARCRALHEKLCPVEVPDTTGGS